MSFIEVRKLTHIYKTKNENGAVISEKTALDHLDFAVEEGEFVAVLGANGCGKTTLARHLNALLLPTEGSVLVDGKNTADEEELYAIRSTVGMVFQDPDNQLVAQMLEDEVAFGPENLGLPTGEIRKRVDEALKAVGLAERRHFLVQHLSGGQKQLAAIAGVLAMQPKCIVLDEATSMLDPRGRRQVLNAVVKLRREKNISIVMITHDIEEALNADRVCVMDCGRIVLSGKPEDVLQKEDEIVKYGLELPQAAEIARKLRDKGIPVRPGVLTEEDLKQDLVRLGRENFSGFGGKYGNERIDGAAEKSEKAGGSEKTEKEKTIKNPQYFTASENSKHGEKLIALDHVTQRYFSGTEMQVVALKNVSFSVHAGEFIAVIGQTGSGKSTLLDLLGGLAKPCEGTVMVYKFVDKGKNEKNSATTKNGTKNGIKTESYTGKKTWRNTRNNTGENTGSNTGENKKSYTGRHTRSNTEKNKSSYRGKKTGIVFQYPDHQLFEETVLEDVMFGPKNLGMNTEQAETCARQALQVVKLPEETWGRSPLILSGGEKRKAALAGVLAMGPEILLLDEPTAGLARADRTGLFHMLRDEYQKKGKTVLFTTHHMEDAVDFADRVIVLHEGEVVFDGSPKEVFQHGDELREIGLDVPLSVMLEEEFFFISEIKLI